MDVIYAAVVLAGGAYLLSTSIGVKKGPERPKEIELKNLDVRSCHAVADVTRILTSHGKTSEMLVDSMNLMLYQLDHPDVDIGGVIPEDAWDVIENGREYMSRFTPISGDIYHFLAGVIEMEVEKIRLDNEIPYLDKENIRKLVDVFYYKELVRRYV